MTNFHCSVAFLELGARRVTVSGYIMCEGIGSSDNLTRRQSGPFAWSFLETRDPQDFDFSTFSDFDLILDNYSRLEKLF